MTNSDPGFDLDSAIVSLEGAGKDGKMLLKLLVEQLSDALGDRIKVVRQGGLIRKSNEIKSVEVKLGDDVMEAVVDGPSIRCTIGHTSGGIRIKSEQVDMPGWLSRLLSVLSKEASQSQATKSALENFVIGGSSPEI